MVSPEMAGGQSGVLGHAVSHVVVGMAYQHAPAQILFPIYMAKTVLGMTKLKVTAIISNVEKSHQVSLYL
jgi:hypothetical protein